MKALLIRWFAGGLICSAGAFACSHEEHVSGPTQHSSAPPLAVGSSPPRGNVVDVPPSSLPTASPPDVDSVAELPEPSIKPEPSINVTPPAAGVTEQQADDRTRATQTLSLASSQASRLKMMESAASGARREDIDSAVENLQSKGLRVLQDLQELEMAPPDRNGAIRVHLDRDVSALTDALHASYAIAPAPFQGLPQPSPLPPPAIR